MAPPPGCRAACVLVPAVLLLALAVPAFTQQITYEYDALGRLILMTSPEGIAQWEYDAVGNILRITSRRYADVSGPVAILGMNPPRGAPGTVVTLYGRGFGATPAENQVAFSGTVATVSAAAANTLAVTVPTGAATGLISLTAPQGSATSPEPFTVIQALAVVPDQADVALKGNLDFQATLAGVTTTDVTWRVNGVVGGSSQFGTITTEGTYTAPTVSPPLQPVPVEAVLTADPTRIARASVRVTGQITGLASAPAVSLTPPSTAVRAAATPVSLAPAATQTGFASATPVSLTGGPVVTAVTPATGPPGGVDLVVNLNGTGLMGATAVQFLRDGALDSTLVATGVTANGTGTTVTFAVSISTSALQGIRVVRVITPNGSSSHFDLGSNTFTVAP